MSVDLSDFVDSLKREVNPPGTDDFPAATTADWVGNLADAFWEARLDGLLAAWTCDNDGLVVPQNVGGVDMGRDMVQLVVLYASFRILRNALRGLRTMFSATAGPVKFEYAQSATLLTAIMADIKNRRDLILLRLSDIGQMPVYVLDALAARDQSIIDGNTYWINAGSMMNGLLAN